MFRAYTTIGKACQCYRKVASQDYHTRSIACQFYRKVVHQTYTQQLVSHVNFTERLDNKGILCHLDREVVCQAYTTKGMVCQLYRKEEITHGTHFSASCISNVQLIGYCFTPYGQYMYFSQFSDFIINDHAS